MFKIGDIVTGLTETQYRITNSLGTYEVVEILDTRIMVRVLTHTAYPMYIGEKYFVHPERFQLVEPYNPQTSVLKKIAHLHNLFENRKKRR